MRWRALRNPHYGSQRKSYRYFEVLKEKSYEILKDVKGYAQGAIYEILEETTETLKDISESIMEIH